MDYETALSEAMRGKAIRRKSWPKNIRLIMIDIKSENEFIPMIDINSFSDFIPNEYDENQADEAATDWEVFED